MKVTKEQFIGVTYEELLALNDELLAYNDELLALMRLKALAVMGELQEENERLKADNAKLRELVRQMHPRAKAFLQLGVQLGCNDTLSYDWELQMRELGVDG